MTSTALMNAILSMDSYNRDYDMGVDMKETSMNKEMVGQSLPSN